MIVSLLKPAMKRRQLIVWKASTGTLLIVVLSLVIQIAESIVRSQAMETNPFITLSIAANVAKGIPLYTKGIDFIELLYYKRGTAADMKNSIRDRRKESGISQEELAKKCCVSRQTINAIENNTDPSLSLAFRLAAELGATVDELFTP